MREQRGWRAMLTRAGPLFARTSQKQPDQAEQECWLWGGDGLGVSQLEAIAQC